MLRRGIQTASGNLKFAELEIRHQRNPDVIIDFVRNNKLLRGKICENKPQEDLYNLIETLLPVGKYNEENKGKNKLLELWAEKDHRRKGWINVYEDYSEEN